ncbi:MAG: outer membrane beta-barrel protein [Bryobacteraceae bacterium]|jgi:outer membrane protein W
MNKLAAVLAVVFLAVGSSNLACAQTGDFWFNAGESILSSPGLGSEQTFGGTSHDIQLTNGFRFGFRFGFNIGDHLGAEVGYAYNRTQLQFNTATAGVPPGTQEGMAFHQVGFNGMYYLTADRDKIRPFVTAGIHFDNFVPPGSSLYGGGSTKFGANFGGGVKFHIHGIWGGRIDVREYVNGKPSFGFLDNSGALWQTEVSAGVGIGF